jgi:hypothetical protein
VGDIALSKKEPKYKAKASINEVISAKDRGSRQAEHKYDHPGRGKYVRKISTYHIEIHKKGERVDTRIAFGWQGMRKERGAIKKEYKGGYSVRVFNTTRGNTRIR